MDKAIAASLLNLLIVGLDEEVLARILGECIPERSLESVQRLSAGSSRRAYLSYDNGVIDILDDETDEVVKSFKITGVTVVDN